MPVLVTWVLMDEHMQPIDTKAGHPWEGCCSAFLRMSEEVAAAFLSLPEEHSDNRNGILKQAA